MGQCYSVHLKIKAKDESQLLQLSTKFLEDLGARKICTDSANLASVVGEIRFILGASQGMFSEDPPEGGFRSFRSAFDATYSWETVLADWFKEIAPALEDGSLISVYPDEGQWMLQVEDGKATDLLSAYLAAREKLKAIHNTITSDELCAEAMVSEIGTIL